MIKKRKPVLYVPVGMSGCGKSTYYHELKGVLCISSDGIRKELFGDESIQFDPRYGKDVKACHAFVFQEVHRRTEEALKSGKSVYYDATNLVPGYRRQILRDFGKTACVKAILFQTGPAVCRKRNRSRKRQVPEEAMAFQEKLYRQISRKTLIREGFDEVMTVNNEYDVLDRSLFQEIYEAVSAEEIMELAHGEKADLLKELVPSMVQAYQGEHFIEDLFAQDAVTEKLYPSSSSRITFPWASRRTAQKAVEKGIQMYTGQFGDQTSQWHKETLIEHTYMDMYSIAVKEPHAEDLTEAVLIAALHDVGKKYSGATNGRGEMSFWGHEKISAFLACGMLEALHYPDDLVQEIVTVIFWHNIKQEEEEDIRERLTLTEEQYGSHTLDLLRRLLDADTGCRSEQDRERRLCEIPAARSLPYRMNQRER